MNNFNLFYASTDKEVIAYFVIYIKNYLFIHLSLVRTTILFLKEEKEDWIK